LCSQALFTGADKIERLWKKVFFNKRARVNG
jgi:hypothetical protein